MYMYVSIWCSVAYHLNGRSWGSPFPLSSISTIPPRFTWCTVAPWHTKLAWKALHNTQRLSHTKLPHTPICSLTILPGIPSSPDEPGSPFCGRGGQRKRWGRGKMIEEGGDEERGEMKRGGR